MIGSTVGSLGASGALFALLGIYCTLHPDDRLSIIFFPWFDFTAESAKYGLLMIDALGMVLQWSYIDHAAHFGGMLFGLWWIKEGHKYLKPIVQRWHNERLKLAKK